MSIHFVLGQGQDRPVRLGRERGEISLGEHWPIDKEVVEQLNDLVSPDDTETDALNGITPSGDPSTDIGE